MVSEQEIIESLSPQERKILPFLKEKTLKELAEKAESDEVAALRALEYLENKKVVELNTEVHKQITLGVNGVLYQRLGLPERRLLHTLSEVKRPLSFEEAQKESKLSDNEFKIALGVVKKKAMIELKGGKIMLQASQEEISKKMLEERFLENLPKAFDALTPEEKYALEALKNRKEIIDVGEQKTITFAITPLGEKIMQVVKKGISETFIEQVTQQMIQSEEWKGKKFRRYDVTSPVPRLSGGRRHFVNQALEYIRKIWTDLGFEEMTGNMTISSFWNFDVLFQPQDHPAREMQDTFFLEKKDELPSNKKLVEEVKKAHEQGTKGSKGWQYAWAPEEARRVVLRTHTTCLSAQTLANLNVKKDLPKKYFAVGKCFRNETIDWSHGFEFYQTEGIVIDKNVTFQHLLGYLKIFYQKMGFEKIRFRPSYFPYTEPSVEIEVWHPEKKKWVELGGAGMFRPEVTIPLLGEDIPILAWGQGVDRIIVDFFGIKDLRELYKNDINQLRKIKVWTK